MEDPRSEDQELALTASQTLNIHEHKSSIWDLWPPEIRTSILEALVFECEGNLAQYAPVCKEWRDFIEQRTFKRLKLSASYLGDFPQRTRRNRHLVKHIWLHIELPDSFPCWDCGRTQDGQDVEVFWDDRAVSNVFIRLLERLADWGPEIDVALEISIEPLSDSQHWGRNLSFGRTPGSLFYDGTNASEMAVGNLHDPYHGFINGRQVNMPPVRSLINAFAPICLIGFSDDWWRQKNTRVLAVKTFIVRRQTRRHFRTMELAAAMKRFPLLHTVMLEPWYRDDRLWDSMHWESGPSTDFHIKAYSECIGRVYKLNPLVKRISIFRDFNEDYLTILRPD